ncbi:gamma-glutamylcyclotransferase [Vibrio zhanjiangensis]|uniref:Gamma-glutamylcyclotransferase n=1 Tax=Vibrio zhanjiangensis TaxID=1046128 RepID=A0ABQ6F1Y3_9VIBR|nr:gamma-glutamylcyclotransferase family protein [Vibrio zhanjiangensis]GLT19513.1 gamma-glutamylcyclotransferase [Vibrio zhanjiangensis]
MATYIFGYGSLINSASRQLTGATGLAYPAIIHGFKRTWGKLDKSDTLSPLVVQKGQGLVNGVLIEIQASELQEFDIRERSYSRVQVSPSQIGSDAIITSDDNVWLYLNNNAKPPCQQVPIMQSYVDTVLAGCLEISEPFAKQFIEHTLGWHFPRQDDRHQPQYTHLAGVYQHHYALIDKLLKGA